MVKTLDNQVCSEPVEYIFALDNCSDNTFESLKALYTKNPLTVIEVQECCVAAARNKGVEAASGDYLLFFDDDVLPQDGCLEEHIRFLRQNTSKKYAFIGPCPIDPAMPLNYLSLKTKKWWDEVFKELADPHHKSTYTDCLTGNFSLLKENFYLIGEFDENLRNDGREDYEFGIRLHKAGLRIKYIEKALAYHYPNLEPKPLLKKAYSFGRADVYIVRKHPDFVHSLNMLKIKRFNLLEHTTIKFINLLGIERFVNISSWLFNNRINSLFEKKSFRLYRSIYTIIYHSGVVSAVGGVNEIGSFITRYYDLKKQ